jgi:hypothetical protein
VQRTKPMSKLCIRSNANVLLIGDLWTSHVMQRLFVMRSCGLDRYADHTRIDRSRILVHDDRLVLCPQYRPKLYLFSLLFEQYTVCMDSQLQSDHKLLIDKVIIGYIFACSKKSFV